MLNISDGIPCQAKADLMWVMTVVLLVSGSLATYKNGEGCLESEDPKDP